MPIFNKDCCFTVRQQLLRNNLLPVFYITHASYSNVLEEISAGLNLTNTQGGMRRQIHRVLNLRHGVGTQPEKQTWQRFTQTGARRVVKRMACQVVKALV